MQYADQHVLQCRVVLTQDQVRPELGGGVAQPHGGDVAGQHESGPVGQPFGDSGQVLRHRPLEHLRDHRITGRPAYLVDGAGQDQRIDTGHRLIAFLISASLSRQNRTVQNRTVQNRNCAELTAAEPTGAQPVWAAEPIWAVLVWGGPTDRHRATGG
jgi:hypothetical protein